MPGEDDFNSRERHRVNNNITTKKNMYIEEKKTRKYLRSIDEDSSRRVVSILCFRHIFAWLLQV